MIEFYFKSRSKDKKPKESSGKFFNKTNIVLLVIFAVFAIFISLANIIDDYVRVKTSSTFKQHLTILSPHTSDQEYKELLARFASMRSKKDFDNLNKSIIELANKYKISLPENKLYPF